MKNLKIKAFAGLFALFVVMAAVLFIPAWTLYYWQAWVFLAVFFGSAFAITIYLMKKDPALLERRTTAGPTREKETSQKIIQSIAQVAFLLVIIFPVLDHRFGWSTVAPYINAAGNLLVAVGFYIVFLAFKENSYASALIEVDSDIIRTIRAGAPSDVYRSSRLTFGHAACARFMVGRTHDHPDHNGDRVAAARRRTLSLSESAELY